MDFSEAAYCEDSKMLLEDKKALTIMEQSLIVVDNDMNSLKTRLKRDPDLYDKYKKGIGDYVNRGYACKVDKISLVEARPDNSSVWYLPHHPVVHPQKPEKPRIVFDCATMFRRCIAE